MDEYEDFAQCGVLWIDHTDRDADPDDGEGYDETSVFRGKLDVSSESSASSTVTYEVSVLSLVELGGDVMGEFVMELWAFMKERKKFWLLPIIAVLLMLGTLIVLTQGSAVAPFVYTLF